MRIYDQDKHRLKAPPPPPVEAEQKPAAKPQPKPTDWTTHFRAFMERLSEIVSGLNEHHELFETIEQKRFAAQEDAVAALIKAITDKHSYLMTHKVDRDGNIIETVIRPLKD